MADASLEIQFEDRDGIRIAHVAGPLDSANHDVFRRQMDPVVNRDRLRVVLDCEKLTYVNSRGLLLLAHYQRSAVQNLSFFGIAALNQRIIKAMEMLGIIRLVKLYATIEEALQAAKVL